MPANTPIYGWPYPLGTDRVADGDDAIKNLAQGVEATLSAGYTFATPTFSGAASDNAAEHSTVLYRFYGGKQVLVHLAMTSVTSWAAGTALFTVPGGWVPAIKWPGWIHLVGAATLVPVVLNQDGILYALANASAGGAYRGQFSYVIG